MKQQKCAVCKNSGNYEILYKENFNKKKVDEKVFSARRMPDKLHYRLVKCKKCGLIYSNPILEEKEIKDLYTKAQLTYDKEIDNLKITYGRYLQNKVPVNKGKILEIGCGNGFFLEEALKVGFKDVYGIEPSPDVVKKAPLKIRKKIAVDFYKPRSFRKNFFDVICCFQTLDHIIEPNEFIQTCFKDLKKNGYVLFITHNTRAISAKVLGEKSPIFDIEHVYLFDKNNIRKIFEDNGFEVIDVFDVVNRCSLPYLIKMFPFPISLKNASLWFLHFLGADKINFNIRFGNLGIVAKKN